MDRHFWCVAVVFNPAGYRSRLDNYHCFSERLARQNIHLLTVELAFHDQPHSLLAGDRVLHLRSRSVLWQKERLMNYALLNLPNECDRVAWLDSDLLLPDGWAELLMERLDHSDFVQLFERVVHLRPGERRFGGEGLDACEGIVRQCKRSRDRGLPLLSRKAPGSAWAAKRKAIGSGLYDRLIVGSGDHWLADCLLHREDWQSPFLSKMTLPLRQDMEEWQANFLSGTDGTVDYLPLDIYHLWHGSERDRGYHTRQSVFKRYDFDPKRDLKLERHVWEWASDKPGLHQAVTRYFRMRKEDDSPDTAPHEA